MFQKLLVLRVVRPDKMTPSIKNYVANTMGQEFTEPPLPDLELVYKDTSNIQPAIFILSPGTDPFNMLQSFANAQNKNLFPMSLGQGQGPKAEKKIKESVATGDWVLLQNCHVYPSWMQELERIVNELDPKQTKHDFRLWLTSYPSPKFPVTVLQNGIKMTNEAPKGLRTSLRRSMAMDTIIDPNFFNGCKKSKEFHKLLFGLCFFNAVIQERREFGPLGWNIPYEFSENDLRISARQLRMYLDEYQDIPFDAIKYLTGECNFGGRVTDDKDRRLIMEILNDYFLPDIFNEQYKFSPSGLFYAPKEGPYDDYIEFIKQLPEFPQPEVFGFHFNANITKDLAETQLMFDTIISTQSQAGNKASGGEGTDLNKLAQAILDDLPMNFRYEKIVDKYPVDRLQSLNTLLQQEVLRFNKLLNEIKKSLADVQKALEGKVSMSPVLEAMIISLLNGKIPENWMKVSYPSLKPLASYIVDLKQRLEFFADWEKNDQPVFFNLSRFFFTQGFLTGVLQNYARKENKPIDEVLFDFYIIDENAERPEDGVNVYGLFLEGARWDHEKQELSESMPRILFSNCPYMWLKPMDQKQQRYYTMYYESPVYKTAERRGVLSTTGHSTNFVMMIHLPTKIEPRHWVKRGVAGLTQLSE